MVGTPPAASIITETVLLLIGVVGVPGPKSVLNLFVVARALVFVFYEQSDGRTGGLAFEYAGQDFHSVGFFALARVARRTRSTPL